MKARALIGGASFGPEAVKAIGQAFDEAWTVIAHHFGEDPVIQETARLSQCRLVGGDGDQPGCRGPEESRAPSDGSQLQVLTKDI